jgi:hypothetical protein
MSTQTRETKINLKTYLLKGLFWSVLAAAVLIICIGLPVLYWLS